MVVDGCVLLVEVVVIGLLVVVEVVVVVGFAVVVFVVVVGAEPEPWLAEAKIGMYGW